MFIKDYSKIKLDLYKLKKFDELKKTYKGFKINLKKYFNKNKPIKIYFKNINCPLCKSKNNGKIFVIDNFTYCECFKCKSIFNNPILKDKFYKEIYKVGAYKDYVKNLTEKGKKIRTNLTERRKYNQISSYFKKRKNLKLLDIGCGTGTLISLFVKNNWKTLGIEPSKFSYLIAKSKNLNVTNIFFEEFNCKKKYDVITLFGVLEHVTNPYEILSKATKYLKKGGIIVFEVPSADSLIMNYLKSGHKLNQIYRFIEAARHLTFFSENGVEIICKKLNLKIIFSETNGLDIQTIFNDKKNNNIKEILNVQDLINNMNIGDHYRFFLTKN